MKREAWSPSSLTAFKITVVPVEKLWFLKAKGKYCFWVGEE